MIYTLEQKREALAKGELWWRFPKSAIDENRAWARVNEDYEPDTPSDAALSRIFSEYFIGPTPPRVLSELEGELQEALKALLLAVDIDTVRMLVDDEPFDNAQAAIQKAESTT